MAHVSLGFRVPAAGSNSRNGASAQSGNLRRRIPFTQSPMHGPGPRAVVQRKRCRRRASSGDRMKVHVAVVLAVWIPGTAIAQLATRTEEPAPLSEGPRTAPE